MKYIQKYYYILTGFIAFVFYLLTIAPSVIQIDTGELAAVQCTLGIAHPTGYPLFTILGYIFSLIPLPLSKIFQMNLLAAIYCAVAVSVFTFTSKMVLDNLGSFQFVKIPKEKTKRKKKDSDKIVQPVSLSPLNFLNHIKSFQRFLVDYFLHSVKHFGFRVLL